MARGGRAHWLRRERGPGPAALIGQRGSAEPGNPASRWGKWGRDRTHPELRAQEPQVGARHTGVRRPEPGPGGKGQAPGRMRRARPPRWRCPQGAKTGRLLPETGPSSSPDAGPLPVKGEGLSPPREENSFQFPKEKGSSSGPQAPEVGFPCSVYPLQWNVHPPPPQSGVQPPRVSRAPLISSEMDAPSASLGN